MMDAALLVLVVGAITLYALMNGFLDGGGIVSTVIATRTLEPFPALAVAAVGEVAGLLLLGRAVAHTLGKQLIVIPEGTGTTAALATLVVALIGALGWNFSMWRLGLPSSSSHALLGGLLGAFGVQFGAAAVHLGVFAKVLLALALVPIAAALLALFLAKATYYVGSYLTPAASRWMRALHIAALVGVAMAHGSNDGQKSLGLVWLVFLAWAGVPRQGLPLAIEVAVGILLAAGVLGGSHRTYQTLGRRIYRVQNLQGMSAELSTMVLVGGSSLTGFPMASSHVLSSAVLGAGAAVRPRGVRWTIAGDILVAWIFTIPSAAAVSGGLMYVVSQAL